MGYGELRSALKLRAHEVSLLFRNNLKADGNKGAVELGWAFPLIRSMKGFVQYFNGYGDSLLDYNIPVSRVSVGVTFSDWL
jgi:phospholipase A1